MTPDKTEQLLYLIFCGTDKHSIMLSGPPGVGKTSIVAQAAERAGVELMTLALPTCEAVDLRGLPSTVSGKTVWASPLPKEGSGVLLLDEISSAAPDVQVAAHHLVWQEQGSDMTLGSGWHVVMTGNRAQDRTLYRAMSAPMRNRVTLLSVEADLGAFERWAMANNVHPAVIGFLRWRPEMLTTKELPQEGAFPSPRSWHKTSVILQLNVTVDVERELLEGTVGLGATTEFAAYLRTVRELPSIEAILNNQHKAEIPSSPSLLYALVTNLAQYTRQYKESAMQYVARMPSEFALLYLRDILGKYDIAKDESVREWIGKHKTLFDTENS